jgi:hypothetical protein
MNRFIFGYCTAPQWAYFPLFARGNRYPTVLYVWGSNPPVSACGCPVTQRSCRASPQKPRKSPQALLKLSHQSPRTGEF